MFKKCKRIAILILATLMLFTGCIVGYGYNINSIKQTQTENTNRIKIEEFNKIYLYTILCKNNADEYIDALSEKIEYEIRDAYPDLSVLKDELSNDDYGSVYEIFAKNIRDKFFGNVENGNNDIFVATLSNILVDFSYNNNSITDGEVKLKTWDFLIKNNYNKELASLAKEQIINKSRDIIILEREKSSIPNHIKITNPTYENLLEVYLHEGLEGLKNYTVLVPAYITDTGDIFDSDDFQTGVRIKNYKFIVIQEFNIYDQIKSNYPELFNDDAIQIQKDNDNKVMNYTYSLGIALIASYIVTLILLMSVFNIIIVNNKDKDSADK